MDVYVVVDDLDFELVGCVWVELFGEVLFDYE